VAQQLMTHIDGDNHLFARGVHTPPTESCTTALTPHTRANIPPKRDFSAYTELNIPLPPNVPNPPDTLLCIFDFMASAGLRHNPDTPPCPCQKPHTRATGKRATTRLHMNELLKYFPGRYSRAAAKYQCCYYLNQHPLTALTVMAALDANTIHFK
jgi:hypothetical protein